MSETLKPWRRIQLENAFPKMITGFAEPCRNLILVQYRLERSYTATKLIINDEARGYKKDGDYNQTVKVLKVPETAFAVRQDDGSLRSYAEGPACKVGDYIRIPAIGIDKLYFPFGNNPEYMGYIKSISDEARTALDKMVPRPLYSYIADEGFMPGRQNTIPLGFVSTLDIVAKIEDPLLPLNGLDPLLDNREVNLTMLPKTGE